MPTLRAINVSTKQSLAEYDHGLNHNQNKNHKIPNHNTKMHVLNTTCYFSQTGQLLHSLSGLNQKQTIAKLQNDFIRCDALHVAQP